MIFLKTWTSFFKYTGQILYEKGMIDCHNGISKLKINIPKMSCYLFSLLFLQIIICSFTVDCNGMFLNIYLYYDVFTFLFSLHSYVSVLF